MLGGTEGELKRGVGVEREAVPVGMVGWWCSLCSAVIEGFSVIPGPAAVAPTVMVVLSIYTLLNAF